MITDMSDMPQIVAMQLKSYSHVSSSSYLFIYSFSQHHTSNPKPISTGEICQYGASISWSMGRKTGYC